jgi:hypothetical protein
MKRAAILVSALAVVLYTVGMSAQAKPSFAGKWTMDAPATPPAAPPAGGGGGGRGGGGRGGGPVSTMAVTITQDATTLTIDKVQPGRGGAEGAPIKLTYKLDGTDSKNMVAGRGGQMEQTAKAVWEGDKLTISTTQTMGDAPVTTKQSISMDGAKLKVENFGADGAATTTMTYSKSM